MEKGIWYNMEVESGITESGITESGITLSFKLWDGQIILLAWHNLGDLAWPLRINKICDDFVSGNYSYDLAHRRGQGAWDNFYFRLA